MEQGLAIQLNTNTLSAFGASSTVVELSLGSVSGLVIASLVSLLTLVFDSWVLKKLDPFITIFKFLAMRVLESQNSLLVFSYRSQNQTTYSVK